MIYYNKAGFFFNRVECNGNFESIMDEFTDDMVLKINYTNPDNHVPEA